MILDRLHAYTLKVLHLLVYVFVSLIAGLFLLEGGVRGFDALFPNVLRLNPGYDWRAIGRNTKTYLGHVYRYNEYGFRGADFPGGKPSGEFRIVVVGDSIAYGQAVAEEERFPERLEAILKRRIPRASVRVIALASRGAHPGQYIDWLERFEFLQPDLVVLQVADNDPRSKYAPEYEEWNRRYPLPIPGPLKRYLSKRSALFQVIQGRYDRYLRSRHLRPDYFDDIDFGYREGSLMWKGFVRDVGELGELARELTGSAPVGFFATQHLAASGRALERTRYYRERIGGVLRRSGFEICDILGYVVPGEDLAASRWDGHPNARAHEIFARCLVDVIAPMIESE